MIATHRRRNGPKHTDATGRPPVAKPCGAALQQSFQTSVCFFIDSSPASS
ncbi:hypothetical protein C4K40_3915 [Pseudomonas sp. CMR5c]|nr:hypothetical protein C4K40_3915 [Pseudomonas sp. CMR5c]